jgi:hypothetical protein
MQDELNSVELDPAVLHIIVRRPTVLTSTSERIARTLDVLVRDGICSDRASAAQQCMKEPLLLAINAQALRRKALLLRQNGFESVPPACFSRSLKHMAERIAYVQHAQCAPAWLPGSAFQDFGVFV